MSRTRGQATMRQSSVATFSGFTLIELLVVISIIALLMAVLMPALQRVRAQARAIACRSNLRQFGTLLAMYTNDHDGRFFPGYATWSAGDDVLSDGWYDWLVRMRPYYRDANDVLLCPAARTLSSDPLLAFGQPPIELRYGDKCHAWREAYYSLRRAAGPWTPTECYAVTGSYGLNSWVMDMTAWEVKGSRADLEKKWYWNTVFIKSAEQVPVFFDCIWTTTGPYNDICHPPDYEGQLWEVPGSMRGDLPRVCINRHDGGINSLFIDWSVRKVGLKELWTLKWHRAFNTGGRWTRAGGVQPEEWPPWMRRFKDY